jgi:hypothetical protein
MVYGTHREVAGQEHEEAVERVEDGAPLGVVEEAAAGAAVGVHDAVDLDEEEHHDHKQRAEEEEDAKHD